MEFRGKQGIRDNSKTSEWTSGGGGHLTNGVQEEQHVFWEEDKLCFVYAEFEVLMG